MRLICFRIVVVSVIALNMYAINVLGDTGASGTPVDPGPAEHTMSGFVHGWGSTWTSATSWDGGRSRRAVEWWKPIADMGKKLKDDIDREIENARQTFGGAAEQIQSIERVVHQVASSSQLLSQHILSADDTMHVQLERALQDAKRTLEDDHRSNSKAGSGHDSRRRQIARDLDLIFARVYEVLRPFIALSSEEFAKELDAVRQALTTLLIIIGDFLEQQPMLTQIIHTAGAFLVKALLPGWVQLILSTIDFERFGI
ncbi:hypothetical protein PENSPDRAFT_755277 [Peniophora sp. CONT]|nr:hypothetical protein PENSPDRAFT_755277 [Peniophora sp. CONT]